MSKPEFISPIPPTEDNARAIQALTFKDLAFMRIPNPQEIADSADPTKVARQLERLEEFPERYAGYEDDSGLVAFVKTNEWFYGDEAPFVENRFARSAMIATAKLRGGSLSPKAFGIFGLATDEKLTYEDAREIQSGLLDHAIKRGLAHAAGVINITVDDFLDPVIPMLTSPRYGFEPVGPRAEVPGVPGMMQRRYQSSL